MPVENYRQQIARRRVSVRVLLDQSLVADHAAADERLQAAISAAGESLADPVDVVAARDAVEAIEAAITATEVEFVFAGVGRRDWLALVAEHPPTDEQAAAGFDFNPDTFHAAAVAASVVTPGDVDLEVAEFLAAELDLAEWGKLWAACLEANLGVASRPKSVAASVHRRMNARSSSTALHEGSLVASSSAEE